MTNFFKKEKDFHFALNFQFKETSNFQVKFYSRASFHYWYF